MKTPYSYNTITDFLISQPLTIDVEIDDAYSGCFSVKGVELEATVLYAGISDFARLSVELSAAEMLIYMNMFLAWLRESSFSERFCVIERFLDNALVLLFSTRFGSEDPFADALLAARWMGEHDSMKFCPDIGIASGTVMAGFTGTPKEYSASVFGRPLILAAGCARLKLRGRFDSIITFPAAEWRGRSFEALFSPLATEGSEKGRDRQEPRWRLGEPREVDFPGSGRVALQDIAHIIPSMPSLSAETKVREWMELIRAKGYYKKKD